MIHSLMTMLIVASHAHPDPDVIISIMMGTSALFVSHGLVIVMLVHV
jgi:hypothetical protein